MGAPDVTMLLHAWSGGDDGARDRLAAFVYSELRQRAGGAGPARAAQPYEGLSARARLPARPLFGGHLVEQDLGSPRVGEVELPERWVARWTRRVVGTIANHSPAVRFFSCGRPGTPLIPRLLHEFEAASDGQFRSTESVGALPRCRGFLLDAPSPPDRSAQAARVGAVLPDLDHFAHVRVGGDDPAPGADWGVIFLCRATGRHRRTHYRDQYGRQERRWTSGESNAALHGCRVLG
jgi:hypothetical protein